MVTNIIQVKILNFLHSSSKTYKNVVKGGKKMSIAQRFRRQQLGL